MKRLLLLITICISSVSFGQVPNYVPTNGLVTWWGFNGNANDESGNGNNGVNNGATLTTDRFGNADAAYYFTGSGCATRIDADVNTTSINGAISFSIWVLRTGSGCQNPRYFEAYTGGNVGMLQLQWFNEMNSPQYLTHRFNDANGSLFAVGGDLYNNNVGNDTWTNIIYTNDGDSARFWQDGIFMGAQVVSPGCDIIVSGDIAIGRMNHPANDAFNGKIDDIGLWNRALTECEITELYTGQDCNVGVSELNSNQPKELIKIVNLLGQEVEYIPNTVLIYQYSDGTSAKVFTIED